MPSAPQCPIGATVITTQIDDQARIHDQTLDESVIYIYRCNGVQVGEDGHQSNYFELHIKHVKIDLRKLLGRAEVQSALEQLVSKPEDPHALAEAQRAITGCHIFSFFHNPWLSTSGHDRASAVYRQSRASGKSNYAVFIKASKGTCVGDRIEQHATYHHNVSVRIDPVELFHAVPELAAITLKAIVSQSSDALDQLDERFAETLRMALVADSRSRPGRGPTIRPPGPAENLRVKGLEGGAITRTTTVDNQHSASVAKVMKSGTMSRPVRDRATTIHRAIQDDLEAYTRPVSSPSTAIEPPAKVHHSPPQISL
jgi:hypothetical protein